MTCLRRFEPFEERARAILKSAVEPYAIYLASE